MFHFCTPWNKASENLFFWYFRGVWKWNIGLKWIEEFWEEETRSSNFFKTLQIDVKLPLDRTEDELVK